MASENIAAISTSLAPSGVAVIRISGDSPLAIAEKIFTPSGKTKVKDFEPNKMYAGEVDADEFCDYGMCVYFKAPKSFTGEDTVEFHIHGGTAISRGVLQKILSSGARLATNGEFTKRAFINGKLSLSSAEGLIDMINSEAVSGVRAGYSLYREKLTREIEAEQAKLTDALAEIDADMDFPEEDLEQLSTESVVKNLQEVIEKLDNLIASYKKGRVLKSGVKVGIVGKPNTGKSSILNALLNFDKAIVSDVAGTTRDIVEGATEINGVRFNFSDTAGIRESDDNIEKLGVNLSKKILDESDILLFVLDASEINGCDESIYSLLADKNFITIVNKTDKSDNTDERADIYVSALYKENIDNLRALLYERAVGEVNQSGEYLVEMRHYEALKRAREKINLALLSIGEIPLELISIDIKDAWDALGEISGKTASEEIIDTIFSKFCVGK
ncbi:MAG: tRNA uridine-5-carboxymethylaminomethyl(34) synthesis GTPase MnmE [Clostridia bacterium]|nr:tRNA uridine-5-carboxymethylaminomethyl(34) synthesis GTPase MnmE [Clostridia bacterium]